jgi:hypothetical protein
LSSEYFLEILKPCSMLHRHIPTINAITERHSRVRYRVQISARRPAILRFVMVFLITSSQMPVYLKLGHDRFLPHTFQFIVH